MKNTPSTTFSTVLVQTQNFGKFSWIKKIAIAVAGSVVFLLGGGSLVLSKSNSGGQKNDAYKDTPTYPVMSRSSYARSEVNSMEYPQGITYKTSRPRKSESQLEAIARESDEDSLEIISESDVVLKTGDSSESRQKNLAAIKNMITLMNEHEDNSAPKKKK